MLASKKTRRGVIGAVVLAGVLAISGYALTNTATIPASFAGDGYGATQSVTATAIHYGLDTADPTKVHTVNFTITQAVATTATAYVQFDGGGVETQTAIANGAWGDSACVGTGTGSASSTWVCTYASAEPFVDLATNLHVVVAD